MAATRKESSHSTQIKPFFILTLPRSGSTLLRNMLDAHPQVTCPPETHLASLAKVTMSLWMDMNDRQSAADRHRLGLSHVRRNINSFIRWHLREAGKDIYCDKSLPNLDHAPLLIEALPGVKFICLYRHSMDQVASAVEASKWGYNAFGLLPYASSSLENLVIGLTRAWCERTQTIRLIERGLGARYFALRYESLVTNPGQTLRGLCDFLDVPFTDAMVSNGLAELRQRGHGDQKVLDNWNVNLTSLGRGSTVPIQQLPELSRAFMNKLLADLDYPLVESNWNLEPSPFRAGLATPGDYLVIQAFFQDHVARQLRSALLDVVPGGFRVRVRVEETAGTHSWVLDASERTVILDENSTVSCESSIVARAAALLSVAAGHLELADAHARGDVRSGSTDNWANLQGLRLLGLALCGYDPDRANYVGAFTTDLLTRGLGSREGDRG
jgi:Sulfotransferase family